MNQEELNTILDNHGKWLRGEDGGIRADLEGADLRYARLRGAILRGAILRGAILRYTNLEGAILRGADLQYADLEGADLRYTNLQDANLRGANLRYARLRGAILRGADLQYTDLRGADLQYTNLEGAILPHYKICPEEGSFIGWKKVGDLVLKLEIPAEARRTGSLVGRKCRAEFVRILEAYTTEGESVPMFQAYSRNLCEYTPGAIVYPDKYNDDIRVECTHGIHFFMTRKEAEEWR